VNHVPPFWKYNVGFVFKSNQPIVQQIKLHFLNSPDMLNLPFALVVYEVFGKAEVASSFVGSKVVRLAMNIRTALDSLKAS
jgi:hypothetical protein